MSGKAVSETTWNDLEKELFSPEEIAESDKRVAALNETIKARTETETQEKE